MRDDRTSYTPHLLLTAVIATWAGSFVVAKLAMEEVTPFALVAARFALGSLCLLPFFLRAPRAQRAATFAPGLLAGLLQLRPTAKDMHVYASGPYPAARPTTRKERSTDEASAESRFTSPNACAGVGKAPLRTSSA